MWIGKFKIQHECFISSKLKNNDLKVLAYVLGVHEDEGNLYYTTFLIPVGREHNVRKFILDLKNDAQVVSLEENHDQLITITKIGKDKKQVASAFSQEFFLVEPILHEEGFEYWHLAAWQREKIIAFYDKVREIGSVEILKLREEKPKDIFYPRIMPELSPQQKKAFHLALEFGYYDHPQKIYLEELAVIMKISRMAYREHLRKAESKMFPFYARSSMGEKSESLDN